MAQIQRFSDVPTRVIALFFGYGFAAKARLQKRTLAVSEGAGRASAPPPILPTVYRGSPGKIQLNVDFLPQDYYFRENERQLTVIGHVCEHRIMQGEAISVPMRPAAQAVDERTSKAGLRAVASFEALKGLAVLVLGVALVAVHSHVQDLVESFFYHLHIDFDRRFGHMMLNAASTISGAHWWVIGAAVGTYSSVRFIEAWGLWNRRVWAEWFALLSGTLYLPWEMLKIVERVEWDRVAVLVINLVIVLYMLWIRIRETRGERGQRVSSKFAG
jgi:uncharacterized membrane protein (DUF2068 family)